MTTGEIAYLSLVLATFGTFGAGALWLSVSEAIALRRAGRREQLLRPAARTHAVEQYPEWPELARAA